MATSWIISLDFSSKWLHNGYLRAAFDGDKQPQRWLFLTSHSAECPYKVEIFSKLLHCQRTSKFCRHVLYFYYYGVDKDAQLPSLKGRKNKGQEIFRL